MLQLHDRSTYLLSLLFLIQPIQLPTPQVTSAVSFLAIPKLFMYKKSKCECTFIFLPPVLHKKQRILCTNLILSFSLTHTSDRSFHINT